MANSPPSARSVEKVCRIGLRSASPLVSISTRPKCGILPRSRSATSRAARSASRVRVLQHRQPLPSSVTSSVLSRSSASSMPDRAELVDHQRGAAALRRFEESPHQRGLAGAEEAGDDGRPAAATRARASAAGRTGWRMAEGKRSRMVSLICRRLRCSFTLPWRGRVGARSAPGWGESFSVREMLQRRCFCISRSIKRGVDRFQHAVRIFDDIVVPESQHAIALRFEPSRALVVIASLRWLSPCCEPSSSITRREAKARKIGHIRCRSALGGGNACLSFPAYEVVATVSSSAPVWLARSRRAVARRNFIIGLS